MNSLKITVVKSYQSQIEAYTIMNNRSIISTFLILMLTVFTGCEVIGGIFKAGVWTGVIIIALIVGLIGYAIYAFKNKS